MEKKESKRVTVEEILERDSQTRDENTKMRAGSKAELEAVVNVFEARALQLSRNARPPYEADALIAAAAWSQAAEFLRAALSDELYLGHFNFGSAFPQFLKLAKKGERAFKVVEIADIKARQQ